MFPLLFSIGSVSVYSISVAIVVAWLVFSFLFWRGLRDLGVAEERTFDLTFYATIAAFIGARTGFVLVNWDAFRTNPLRIAAIWVTPGLSLYGGLVAALLVLVFLSRRFKVRLGHVLDAFGPAFGWALIPGFIGAFLDGTYAGQPSATVPWAVRYVGYPGLRHPVQAYELAAVLAIIATLWLLNARAVRQKWSYGMRGLWFFAMFSIAVFVLEFFKDTRVYWGGLRANQWVLVGLFAETLGAFYVRGGGREWLRPRINSIMGVLYGKFSKRRS